MKQGWIQVVNNGIQEPLAPKTLADMVYVEAGQSKTVKEALTEGFVAVYEHTMSVVNSERIHNFEGPSDFTGMGRALITAPVEQGDTFAVNSVPVLAYMGEDEVEELPVGRWVQFINSGTQLDFKGGGVGVDLRVVGGLTRPTNPRNNTVWAKTSTPINRWFVSATAIPNPQVGDGWLYVTSTSTKKLTIAKLPRQVDAYIAEVRQWNGSAWEQLFGSSIFKNNAWDDFGFLLFESGVQYVPFSFVDCYGGTAWTTAGVSNLTLYVRSVWSSGWGKAGSILTNNAIDVTPYSALRVNVTGFEGGANSAWIGVFNARVPLTQGGDGNALPNIANAAAYIGIDSVGLKTINVASLAGGKYIGFATGAYGSARPASSVYANLIELV